MIDIHSGAVFGRLAADRASLRAAEGFVPDPLPFDRPVETAIDADKLVLCWLVGNRAGGCATEFIQDLAGRLAYRVQVTTDGLKVYPNAILDTFAIDSIDYALIHKLCGADPRTGEARYSPAICTGCDKVEVLGTPDPKHISTSYVERQNLSMRMGMRRFTRRTNAFSKKMPPECGHGRRKARSTEVTGRITV